MTKRRIKTLLVANRGEIALRIMRTARKLGIQTVAVYSEADRAAPFVVAADSAILLGPAPARDSYLNGTAIIAAALAAGADAIHPGYGFLAENADFASAVVKAGLIFVGPRPEAIAAMGDKIAAKELIAREGVPVVPGFKGRADLATLRREGAALGFPLLVKAAAGGGGKGMRVVRHLDDLSPALSAAEGEALRAFGDGTLLIERLIEGARHIEVQIFGDQHGHLLHLGERDCSLQRRYQKIIEEAPAPGLDPALRSRLHKAALTAGKSIHYDNAGTVEFILGNDGQFYFLEINTRIQVEHPVTEMLTGIDLVEWQIRVAEGAPLPLTQDEIPFNGHAMEARLYSEDPRSEFRASFGIIHELEWPEAHGALRIDAGVVAGTTMSTHYDAMLAKIVVQGRDRADACSKLVAALKGSKVHGLATNRELLIALAEGQAFATVAHDVHYVAKFLAEGGLPPQALAARHDAAIVALMRLAAEWEQRLPQIAGFRLRAAPAASFTLIDEQGSVTLALKRTYDAQHSGREAQEACFELSVAGGPREVIRIMDLSGPVLALERNGWRKTYSTSIHQDSVWVFTPAGSFQWQLETERATAAMQAGQGVGVAPMPGLMLRVIKSQGQAVAIGDVVAVLEAMKMEHQIAAAVSGNITQLFVKVGDRVNVGDRLFEISPQ